MLAGARVCSGSALSFNGTSDYVSIDNTPALNITGTAITLSAWIYPTKGDVVNGSRIISKRTDAGGTEVYAMILDQYRLNFRLDGVDMVGPIVRLNDWTHVTMVYNGTDKRIYINGVLDADAAAGQGGRDRRLHPRRAAWLARGRGASFQRSHRRGAGLRRGADAGAGSGALCPRHGAADTGRPVLLRYHGRSRDSGLQ